MIRPYYSIVILGSGIAGLAAAKSLSGKGLDILVIDENTHIGGQLLRGTTGYISLAAAMVSGFDPVKTRGVQLIRHLKNARDIHWLNRARVAGIFKDRQLLVHVDDMPGQPGRCIEIRAGKLILATGARERYLPFPGWTLPGVLSLGAAQILLKSHGTLPARNVLVAGSSPLMAAVASQLITGQGNIAGIVDENTLSDMRGFLPLAVHHWPKLLQGGAYIALLILNRVRHFRGFRVVEASGKEQFESAVIARHDRKGRIMPGTEIRVPAGALAIGHGFVPNIEPGIQAGCRAEYHRDLGGWIMAVNTTQDHTLFETSLKNIYAVGELTGIGGAHRSYIQGRLCGLSILAALEKYPRGRQHQRFRAAMASLKRENRCQNEYAFFLNRFSRVPDMAYDQIPDPTLICRCENITMGTIRKRIGQGFDTAAALKKAARCGMGRCQGRICGPVIFDVVSALTRAEPESVGFPTSRAPIGNLAIRSLLIPPDHTRNK
ncbi:MAG: NAD(P)/FAD-dependent oxidoreductase [Desulfobacter sp.]